MTRAAIVEEVVMYGPGTVLASRYRLDERIGGGGMGDVWRATDQILERTVAVKMMRQELVEEPGFADRFLIEARTMAAIKHPGVVAIHDYRGGDDAAFLVMEYVEGEALSRRLHRFGRLDPVRTMHLIAQAADALHAAHEKGVVHRDIKPGNLLVTTAGTVVLTDFGIARSAASTPLTATGAVVGTPSYLAPEQVLGRPATALTDVYALGVVAYECLAGRRPFDGDNPFEVAMKRLREPPPTLAVPAPPPVLAVVERALAAEPEQRWQSAAELAAGARQAVTPGATVPTRPVASGPALVPEFAPARVPMPPADTTSPAAPPAGPTSAPPAGPPAKPVAPTMLESRQSGPPPHSPASHSPAPLAPASPPPVPPHSPVAPRSPVPPHSPVPPAASPPPPWRKPARPMVVSMASAMLLASAAALALYFGGTLRSLGAYTDAYERYLGGRMASDEAAGAATAVAALGAVIAGTGLVLALVLMLLAWPTYLGKRAARGWAITLGCVVLFCCGGPVAVDSFGHGLGSFGASPWERAELNRQVVEAMPSWYEAVVGPVPLVGLGTMLVALFLLTLPPASRYFLRPRPTRYHAHYPYYPYYYGYPPRR